MYKRRNKVFLVRECDYRAHVDVTILRQSWVLCWFFSPGSSALGARWSGWHTFLDRHRRAPCLNRLPSSWTGTVFPGSPSGRPPRKLVLGLRLSPLPCPTITDKKRSVLLIFTIVSGSIRQVIINVTLNLLEDDQTGFVGLSTVCWMGRIARWVRMHIF